MPIYVYRCAQCGADSEVRQGFNDAPLTSCTDCGGTLRRVLQPVGVIFKGSGFYSTDSRAAANGKAKAVEGETKPTSGSDSDGSKTKTADSNTADTKPAATKSAGEKPAAAASSTASSTTSSPSTTKSD
jgi:putative FmdB family regulatory protein